jgi:hypothetical protein
MTGLRNECYSSDGWGYDFTMNALASILFAVFASIPLAITLMETTYEQLREATATTLGSLLVDVEATIVATENGTNAMTLAFDNKASVLRVRNESKAAKAKAAVEKPCAEVDFLKSNNIVTWMANMVDKPPLLVDGARQFAPKLPLKTKAPPLGRTPVKPSKAPAKNDTEATPEPKRSKYEPACPCGCERGAHLEVVLDVEGWEQCACTGCGPVHTSGGRQCATLIHPLLWMLGGRCGVCRPNSDALVAHEVCLPSSDALVDPGLGPSWAHGLFWGYKYIYIYIYIYIYK